MGHTPMKTSASGYFEERKDAERSYDLAAHSLLLGLMFKTCLIDSTLQRPTRIE